MTTCPCGSGLDLAGCCGPFIAGTADAPTAEAVMRARYTAFTQGNLDYVERTHAPEIAAEFNRPEAERAAAEVEWDSLEVTGGAEAGDGTTTVDFTLRFRRHGEDMVQRERAHFRQDGGRWLYVRGDINPKAPPRQVVKVGRNDPCPCGSGKKHKKCCGA